MSDDTRKTHFGTTEGAKTELGSKAAEGAGVGGGIGGTVSAILAAIAAVGTTIAIPGPGLVIAGPLDLVALPTPCGRCFASRVGNGYPYAGATTLAYQASLPGDSLKAHEGMEFQRGNLD